jgi:starch phosphorylase
MKVLVNGGLNLSELDGWWAEAFQPDVGWALGDGTEHGDDPVWDGREADTLYTLLEQEVLAAFYERDARGLPQAWLARMRDSMARLTGYFSANRMVREYTGNYYLPATAAFRERRADGCRLTHEVQRWLEDTRRHWPGVRIASVSRERDGERLRVAAQVYLDELSPEGVRVELYADAATPGAAPERIALQRGEALAGAFGGYHYHGEIATQRPPAHYSVRVIPDHPQVRWPLECGLVYWAAGG